MSLTVIQRFYELAKQSSEAPALALESDGRFQNLPWWFVKSKAKHFGIGLLQLGAKPGDYFYLLPSGSPAAIYAEFGALTVGLKILPFPASLSSDAMERWLRAYPPAFFFSSPSDSLLFLPRLKALKSLRAILLDSEELNLPAHEGRGPPPLTFRKVFNTGIIQESRHHGAYREIRRSLTEQTALSPIQVTPDGQILEQELTYAHVNNLSANLSRAARQKKIRRFLTREDLTVTLARGACLYWPLSLGIPVYLSTTPRGLSDQLKEAAPHALFLETGDFSAFEEWLAPSSPIGGFVSRLKSAWQWRFGWRRNLQVLLSTSPPLEKLKAELARFPRQQWIHLDARWWEPGFVK